MFYFYDPLMNIVPPPATPPAITRVVKAPASPLAPPKGWQWANSKSSSAVAPGTAAPGTVAGGDKDPGKKRVLPPPSTPLPKPAWQPPKGYILWSGEQTKARVSAAPAPIVTLPT
jgi:hypothetical protein